MDDLMAQLRERMARDGVRELVEWDGATDEERVTLYGLCPVHRTPMAYVRTAALDDAGTLQVMQEIVCTACGGEPGEERRC
jgi:hypothetical protein